MSSKESQSDCPSRRRCGGNPGVNCNCEKSSVGVNGNYEKSQVGLTTTARGARRRVNDNCEKS
jgi:hypothetical protein